MPGLPTIFKAKWYLAIVAKSSNSLATTCTEPSVIYLLPIYTEIATIERFMHPCVAI
jgi:hypothetical protein